MLSVDADLQIGSHETDKHGNPQGSTLQAMTQLVTRTLGSRRG